ERKRSSQRVGQRGLPDSWNVLQKDVPLGQQGGDAELDDFRLAADDTFDIRLQRGDLLERTVDWDGFPSHQKLLNSSFCILRSAFIETYNRGLEFSVIWPTLTTRRRPTDDVQGIHEV